MTEETVTVSFFYGDMDVHRLGKNTRLQAQSLKGINPKNKRLNQKNIKTESWGLTRTTGTSAHWKHVCQRFSSLLKSHPLSHSLSRDFNLLLNYLPKFSTLFAADCSADLLMWLVEQSVAVESSSLWESCSMRWVSGAMRSQWWEYEAVMVGGSLPSQLYTN